MAAHLMMVMSARRKEGTAEIQKMIIGRRLLGRFKAASG